MSRSRRIIDSRADSDSEPAHVRDVSATRRPTRDRDLLLASLTCEEVTRRRAWVRRHVVCRRGATRIVACAGKTGAILTHVPLRPGASEVEVVEASEVLVDGVLAKLAGTALPASKAQGAHSHSVGDASESDGSMMAEDMDPATRQLVELVQVYRPFGDYTRQVL